MNRTMQNTSTINLPPTVTSFLGRERELVEIDQLLAGPTCRLLMLIGPGGIGKTRLAIEAARESHTFVSGVYFVALAGYAAAATR
jgi:ATP/maltotriose-dependent transcriptional regulator MalT